MKGAGAQAEIDAAQKEMRKFKVTDARVQILGEGITENVTRVILGNVRA
jgi:16S rRNA (guanine527-N7)-methyltransferase